MFPSGSNICEGAWSNGTASWHISSIQKTMRLTKALIIGCHFVSRTSKTHKITSFLKWFSLSHHTKLIIYRPPLFKSSSPNILFSTSRLPEASTTSTSCSCSSPRSCLCAVSSGSSDFVSSCRRASHCDWMGGFLGEVLSFFSFNEDPI